MSFQDSQPSENSGRGKVPIPRLDRSRPPPPTKSSGTGKRVEKACLNCRARKVKCNGGPPECWPCKSNGTTCTYPSGRRDRLKMATDHNEAMLKLLRDVQETAGASEKRRIESMLTGITDDVADAAASLAKSSDHTKSPERGEALIAAEVGSNDEVDVMDEDLNRNEGSRATGFVGKNSEIQWMRRMNNDAEHSKQNKSKDEGPFGPPGDDAEAVAARKQAGDIRRTRLKSVPRWEATSCSFYLDDENVDLDFEVDPDELPPFEVAERLLNCYLSQVQDSFPILVKKSFRGQFYRYYASVGRQNPERLPPKWQAILNLVFAIGAAYSHLTEADWRADERDHVVYHLRAWELALKDPWWFSHPDYSQLQITGLLSFYYLTIGHVNRAWSIVGMSLRFGYALGLHLRNEDRSTSLVKKEVLARMWWGLYSLESTLSVITGRPSVGLEKHCSVPLPLPIAAEEIDEAIILSRFGTHHGKLAFQNIRPTQNEPTNCGSFLGHAVKIGLIMSKTLANIYAPSAARNSWETLQSEISNLLTELEQWRDDLPHGFISTAAQQENHAQGRMMLQMYYYSTTILISRPCLCRLDRRIENQSRGSDDFNKSTAETCVAAAKAMANLLPDDPERNRAQVYSIGPWWSMVHYLTQAIAVLLLEVTCEAVHFPRDRQDMVPSLKKLLRWLRCMRKNNAMAVRAYSVSFSLLQKLVEHIHLDISDLLKEHTDVSTATSPPISTSRQLDSRYGLPTLPRENPQHYADQTQYADMQTFDSLAWQDPMDPSTDYSMEGLEYQNAFQADCPNTLHEFFTVAAAPFNPVLPNAFVTSHDEPFLLPSFDSGSFEQTPRYPESEPRDWN